MFFISYQNNLHRRTFERKYICFPTMTDCNDIIFLNIILRQHFIIIHLDIIDVRQTNITCTVFSKLKENNSTPTLSYYSTLGFFQFSTRKITYIHRESRCSTEKICCQLPSSIFLLNNNTNIEDVKFNKYEYKIHK